MKIRRPRVLTGDSYVGNERAHYTCCCVYFTLGRQRFPTSKTPLTKPRRRARAPSGRSRGTREKSRPFQIVSKNKHALIYFVYWTRRCLLALHEPYTTRRDRFSSDGNERDPSVVFRLTETYECYRGYVSILGRGLAFGQGRTRNYGIVHLAT